MRLTHSRPNQLHISTRCQTLKDFITSFGRFVDDDSIFVATMTDRPLGSETAFVFVLASGKPVLRGTCVLRDVWTTTSSPFNRPGIRLGITHLTPRSIEVFDQLKALGVAASETPSSPSPARTLTTSQYVVPVTRAMSEKESFSAPTRLNTSNPTAQGMRVASIGTVLPANPLSSVSDDYLAGHVEARLYEVAIPTRRKQLILPAVAAIAIGLTGVGVFAASASEPSQETTTLPEPLLRPAPATTAARERDRCELHVAVVPADSTVTIDGEPRAAPQTIPVPCGVHHVEISREHYETATAWLAVRGEESINVQLARPLHTLTVATSPAGAAIYIDNKLAGVTPKTFTVFGHVPMTLDLKKPGFRSVTRQLTSSTPRDRFAIRLLPQ